jgi:hypothetical protein
VVTTVGDSAELARAADFLGHGRGTALGAWHGVEGGPWLERSSYERRDEGSLRRWLERYLVRGQALEALERVAFDFDGSTFRESWLERTRGGPNLHARPIVLPAELERDRRYDVGGSAQVRMIYCGEVELALGTRTIRRRGLLLRAEQGDGKRDQWSLAGVGEAWIGAPDGTAMRWLTGWEGFGDTIFGGIPDAWRALPFPELPERDPHATPAGVF